MAVKNSINNNLQNQTNHALLVGGGTNAEISAITAGVTGELLTGVTGANPAFASSLSGDFTFTTSTAGANRILEVKNSDNTNSSSSATLKITVGGSSAGDAQLNYLITAGQSWTQGLDNSASDAYVIAASGALGTTNVMSVSTAGEINYPLQPAFLAVLDANIADVTGDATVYVVILDTEVFDQNADFDLATSTFTAPITGRYKFESCCTVDDLTALFTIGSTAFLTSNRLYVANFGNVGAYFDAATTQLSNSFSIFTDMDAADTCVFRVSVGTSTKTVDVVTGGATNPYTWFSGSLVV